jgi:hypothetical protein
MRYFYPARLVGFLFSDPTRLIDIFSAWNLLAWAAVFWTNPDLLERDSYATFQSLGAVPWAITFLIVGIMQASALFGWHRHIAEQRFIAMALATGCWAAVTVNFMSTGVLTTAGANYIGLTFVTALVGGFLGWKTSTTPS